MDLLGMFRRGSGAPEQPKASYQDNGGGVVINTPQDLADAIAGGNESRSGAVVTANNAMKVATVYACVRLISGAVATMPLHIKRRVNDRVREDASDSSLWRVLRRKPNSWQKPAVFRRMMQTHMLLRGNGYALIVRSRGEVVALLPMHPDRVECKQNDDMSLTYTFTRKNGARVILPQSDVFHLVGLTLDGVNGVTPITFARETIGLAMSMENHGANVFRNGAQVSSVLKHPGKLGIEGQTVLRSSLDAFRSGGENEAKTLILEEGMDFAPMAMTAQDAQWIESRKMSRSEIAMFFGVPPSMIGDNTGSDSNWGTGLEQKSNGFVAYGLEDHLTMWEEAIGFDLIGEDSPDLYARFNRSALARGDIKTRTEAMTKRLQWGVTSPDEERALEDWNPRSDGGGGIYYDPPNTAGGTEKETVDETDNTKPV